MSLDSLSVIQYIPSKYAPDLEWSLGPLFFCLKVFGVPIGQSSWSSSLRRKLVVGGGAILVIWIALSKLCILFNSNVNSNENDWIISFSKITGPVTGLLIAINLFWLACMQWISLWNTAMEIDMTLRFDRQFYHSFRRATTAAIALLLTDGAYKIIMIGLKGKMVSTSLVDMIWLVGPWLGHMYQSLATVLFLCLAWLASMMLERLSDQLPCDGTPFRPALSLQLLRWKRAFGLIRQYIEKINGSFGFILLLLLGKFVFYFIKEINEMLTLIKSFKIESFLITTTGLLKISFVLVLITFFCHRIQRKTQKMSHRLYNLRFNETGMEVKVKLMIIDLNINPPVITAMDFFEIGPKLFPTVGPTDHVTYNRDLMSIIQQILGIIFTVVTSLI